MAFYPYNYLLFGLLCNIGGIGALFYSWKSKLELKALAKILGWSLVVAAALVWVGLSGWEFGLLYAITLPSFSALLYICLNAEIKPRKIKTADYQPAVAPSPKAVFQLFGKLFLILPFGLTTSALVSFGLSTIFVSSELNQMVSAICILPLVWGGFGYWIMVDRFFIRPILIQTSLMIISLVSVYSG
jgi:hypothetical protein